MIYPLANHPKKVGGQARRLRWLVFFLVAAGLLLLGRSSWSSSLQGFALTIGRPFLQFRDNLGGGVSRLVSGFREKESLFLENQRLQETVAALEARLLNYELLKRDNETLREMFGAATPPLLPISAKVISTVWQSPYNLLILDLGSANRTRDFQVGDLVLAHNSILLGAVAEISRNTSKVKLFSAPGTELPVAVGETAVPGLAIGRGGGNFKISLPRSLEVKTGDVVTAPSFGDQLVVGVVEAVEKNEESSLQTLFLRTPLNLFQLDYVAIYPRAS